MTRLARRGFRVLGMAAVALALLTAGNLVAFEAGARGETAAAPEAVARIAPALRGAYD